MGLAYGQQFGPRDKPEIAILDYQSQQQRLMPMLASAYAFHFATLHLVRQYCEMKKTREEGLVAEVHVLSAGLKAYITSYTQKAISVCRYEGADNAEDGLHSRF